MTKNKTWQHEETGRLTTCAIRPGNRWYEVGIATDCEHEDLTGIEGDDMQEIAVKHGMLAPEIRHEPCGEWCNCNAGVDVDGGEWERGVECYRALRRGQHWSVVDGIGDLLRAEALDDAVDKVLSDSGKIPSTTVVDENGEMK